jgi:hypothetical protein
LQRAADEWSGSRVIRVALQDLVDGHIAGFAAAFYFSAALALVAAGLMFVLVRRRERTFAGPVFGRRSRWIVSHSGLSPGLTREPPGSVP